VATFNVIVLGGIALAAPATGVTIVACGGGVEGNAFPSETASFLDAAGFPEAEAGFPHEGPAPIDASQLPDARFPQEGADVWQVDAADASEADAGPCFPRETALPLDSGCGR
jgi:hypothetical protein